MLSTSVRSLMALGVLALATTALADDAYYQIPINDLKITEGERPQPPSSNDWRSWERAWTMLPYAVLDGEGEVYVGIGDSPRFNRWSIPQLTGNAIFIHAAQAGEVTGRLFYPKPDWSGMAVVKFSIPATEAKTEAREAFYRVKEAYYSGLMLRNIPGAASFRHEARQAQIALNRQPSELATNANVPRPRRALESDIATTYELFSGGRAISENLQLDRAIRAAKGTETMVEIDTINGISVPEIDWQPLVKDLKPKLDPLAALMPADQHVVFFPSFAAAVLTADEAERQGTPLLQLAEPKSEDARTADRYQRQLCLSLTGLGRLVGPTVVGSVALTGSDPYYRTGTDLAVLFETPNPAILEALLSAQIELAAGKEPEAKPEKGQIGGLAYHGVRSPDRRVCCYIARLEGAVVVTNSLYQVGRLAGVAAKTSPSIASLPEYVFFRERYRLGDTEESALVFLSDATIRRWCGPRWRIAASRRTQDMAVLAELQAANMNRLMKKAVQPGPIYTDLATVDLGDLTLDVGGVHSSVQGSLEFLTPLAEIPLKTVTKAEADAYNLWRDGYQQNWRWAFDPIALRLTLRQDRLAGDLTVMPLIAGTDYREFVTISQGASFAPDAGDPHDALLHFILAINPKSPMFDQAENFLSTMSKGVTLGWLGSSVAVYADADPAWQELAKSLEAEPRGRLPRELATLPVAVRFEVSNGFRLTAFLAGLRAFIEQTAPGMVRWEALTYKDQPYVKISPTERAKSQVGPMAGGGKELENIAAYYVASGDALLVSLNESVVQHAIDRQLARETETKDKPAPQKPAKPWLGSNVGLQVDSKALEFLGHLGRNRYELAMQISAWANLPILNEWKRQYPDQDPVDLHERVWKVRLVCPGGGRYVWNETFQTMESTVYGHPGEPKSGPAAPPALTEFTNGSFGLTFENQGLRARVSLERGGEGVKPKTE